MQNQGTQTDNLTMYSVWDRSTRWFHWINVICIIGLIAVALFILNNKAFGISNDGKVLLKMIHVYFGYVFAANLCWRLIWGFIGNRYARWSAILPMGKHFLCSLLEYISSARKGDAVAYKGHNPVARLMVTALFILLTTQAITGLTLASTDLYWPPFGDQIKEWVSDKNSSVEVRAGYKEGTDPASYKAMRDFRKPFITTHLYVFYALVIAIVLHIAGVVVTEIREKNGIVSAMFSGKKVFLKKPVDD